MKLKNLLFFAVGGCALGMPATADVTVDGKPVTTSNADTIVVRASDCRVLQRHHPDADVAYQPGVDVKGKPVAPADINPAPDFSREANNFAFAIKVDLDDRLGKGGEGQPRPFGGEGFVGYVEMRDGIPYYNGEPLDRDGIEAVSAACRDALDKNKKDR